ncbi:secreted antigen 1 [Babesia divergens]|uniref:Secreted antigen 1 n=1 Tax=Babesia divergens TaxID=32595 RepID=A0AAD9GDI9_BABDI|nr:secreted antigen 1 [Babesia divergens]
MKFLGILRASALYLLVSAFYGQSVICSNLEGRTFMESPSVRVSEISENPKASTVPASQSGLVFHSSTWDDSQLASAVLFLEEVCREVNAKKFNGKFSEANYDDVSKACVYLSFKLESLTNHFTPAYGPGSASERKEIDSNIYRSVLKPEKFAIYTEWLKKNIQNITESYKKMLEESAKLTEEKLKTETEVGPLKYGFVYNGYWWGEIIYWLPPDVYADTGFLEALNELKTSLDKIPKSPVETSTVDYQINEDDVEEPFSIDSSESLDNMQESSVEPQVVEDAAKDHSTVNASDVSVNLKELVVASHESVSASQPGLVFQSSTWDDSHLASALLFMKEFCWEVKAKKFDAHIPGANIKSLSEACDYTSSYLKAINGSLLSSNVNENSYRDVLKPEKFKDYVDWLVKNISAIKTALMNMHNESFKYSETRLMTDPSVGPLKYGFVYKRYWCKKLIFPQSSEEGNGLTLMDVLSKLKTALKKF